MSMLKIRPFEPAAVKGSGITISLSDSKAGQYIRIGISEDAQRAIFGGPLKPEKHAIKISISDEPGKVHLMGLTATGSGSADGLPIFGGARGSVSLKVMPWCQVPKGKMPARSMPIVHQIRTGDVVVKMPEWAHPPARKIGQGQPLMG